MGSCKNRLIQAGAERFIAKLKVPTTQARTMIPPTPGGSCGTESKASRFQKVNSNVLPSQEALPSFKDRLAILNL